MFSVFGVNIKKCFFKCRYAENKTRNENRTLFIRTKRLVSCPKAVVSADGRKGEIRRSYEQKDKNSQALFTMR